MPPVEGEGAPNAPPTGADAPKKFVDPPNGEGFVAGTPNAELDAAAPKLVGPAPKPIEPAEAPKAPPPLKAGEDCPAPKAEFDAGAPKTLPPSPLPPKPGVEEGIPNAPALPPKEGADAALPKPGAEAAAPKVEPAFVPKRFGEGTVAPPNAGVVGEVPNSEPPGPAELEPNAGAGALPNVDVPGGAPNALPEGVLLAPNMPPPPIFAPAPPNAPV